jgi:GDP-L-fucose synthase
LDLSNQAEVNKFFEAKKPEIVIDAAASVGGILANKEYPYQFFIENLEFQNNLIAIEHQTKVEKFIFLGSLCIYPKLAPQPLKKNICLQVH